MPIPEQSHQLQPTNHQSKYKIPLSHSTPERTAHSTNDGNHAHSSIHEPHYDTTAKGEQNRVFIESQDDEDLEYYSEISSIQGSINFKFTT
jgi:hypothetical protein